MGRYDLRIFVYGSSKQNEFGFEKLVRRDYLEDFFLPNVASEGDNIVVRCNPDEPGDSLDLGMVKRAGVLHQIDFSPDLSKIESYTVLSLIRDCKNMDSYLQFVEAYKNRKK